MVVKLCTSPHEEWRQWSYCRWSRASLLSNEDCYCWWLSPHLCWSCALCSRMNILEDELSLDIKFQDVALSTSLKWITHKDNDTWFRRHSARFVLVDMPRSAFECKQNEMIQDGNGTGTFNFRNLNKKLQIKCAWCKVRSAKFLLLITNLNAFSLFWC